MTLPLSDLETPESPSLATLRPHVEEELRVVLLSYHIPEFDAEVLLRETVVELLYKAESPDDFSRRITPLLQAKCRAYWLTRRWRRFNTLAEDLTKAEGQPSQAQHHEPASPSEARRATLRGWLTTNWRRAR